METAQIETFPMYTCHHSPMARPVLPESERWRIEAHTFVRMKTTDGCTLLWLPGMTTLETDSMYITWHKKPTLKDAVESSFPTWANDGNLYTFHSDGSVTTRKSNEHWYWPPGESESYIVHGTILEPTHFHDGMACYGICL